MSVRLSIFWLVALLSLTSLPAPAQTPAFLDRAGNPTAELLEGGTARLQVLFPQGNTFPYAPDSLAVVLHSLQAGDTETLALTETGNDTGVFAGTIDLVSGPPAVGDGRLQTLWGPPPGYAPEEVTAEVNAVQVTAHVAGSHLIFLDAFGREVTSNAVGDSLRMRLEDHTQDNPQSRDLQMVQVASLQGGDSEPVTLSETGFHTGIFEGSLPTALGGATPGTLQTFPGDTVEALHFNTNTPEASRAQAAITGSSVLFVDAFVQPAAVFLESSQAFVRVASKLADGNPGAADTTQVRIEAALSGDFEFVTLTETGPSTGVFTGGVTLRLGPAQPGDGFLETNEDPGPPHRFDTLTATYNDPAGSSTATAGLTGSRTSFVDAYGAVVTAYPVGSRVYVRVEDHNADTPGQFDSVAVTVAAPSGDSEPLSLLETGKSTGIFLGSLPLAAASGIPGNGSLEVGQPGEPFEATHVDALGLSSSRAEARAAYARIDFIDAAGRPTAELLEGGTARVRMFNRQANAAPYAPDTANVSLHSRSAGDAEVVTLTETGPDTSVFEGTIELATGPHTTADGRLQTLQGPPPEYLAEEVTAEAYDGLATAQVLGSRIVLLDAFGRTVTQTAVGDRLRLRLEDHTQDNPQSRDSQMVQVSSLQGGPSGDTEPLMLTETGFHTGIFEGSLPTELGGATPGTLQTFPGDAVEALHFNTNTPEATRTQVTMTGSSVLFVDAQGQPVAEYLESSQAFVRVVSLFANSNPGAADTTQVRIETELTHDFEFVPLTETGPNTSIFTGGIQLRLGPAQPGDSFLETQEAAGPPHEFDLLTATYNDPAGASLASAGLTGSRTTFVDSFGTPVASYPIGSRVYVRVEDHNADTPGQFDTVAVTVSIPGGDSESLPLLETGKGTGIFLGSLPLEASASFSPGNGSLQVSSPGAVLGAEHIDALGYTSSKDEATVAYSGILFIDETGAPTTELLEGGTARLRMFNLQANSSNHAADTVTVSLHSRYAGDSEMVTLTETAANTSIFEGTFELATGPHVVADGRLQTLQGPQPEYLPEEVTAEAFDGQATAHVLGSRVVFLDAFGRAVTSTAVGDRLRLRLIDHTQDNPQSRDSQMVQVASLQGGDNESVMLTETGFHTGIYEGSLPTELGGATPGVLQTFPGDTVEALHFNTNTPEPTRAQAAITGSSVLFVDAQGQPAAEYLESSQAFVRVVSRFANNPGTVDTLQVRIETELTHDFEFVTLTETGYDTSIFTGGVQLRLGPAQPGDNFLETSEAPGPPHEFDTLTATYNDPTGSSTAKARLTGSKTAFVDAYGTPVTSYPMGSRIYVRVEDHNADTPGQFDTVAVTVAVPGGDTEPLPLLETGKGTGVFLGSLAMEISSNFTAGNGTLQVPSPGVIFEATHVDALGLTSSRAQAMVAFSDLTFIDETGTPTTELLEGGTARLRMFNLQANAAPFAPDTVQVSLHSRYAGDAELVTLTETGPSTNTFEGTVELATGPQATADGRLQTLQGPPPEYLAEEVTAEAFDGQATAHVLGSRLLFLDAFGRAVSTNAVGDLLRLRLIDHTQDNPQSRDSQMVQVTSLRGGYSEPVTLTETGFHTGVYEGSLPTVTTGSVPGKLQTFPGDEVEGRHFNTNTPEPTTARVTMTGSSILFLDAQGQPASVFLESSQAFVRVVSDFANRNTSIADIAQVRIESELTHDFEFITLMETGPNTSVFTGGVNLRLGPAQPGDNFLETQEAAGPPHEFDTLTATYVDPSGSSTVTAGLTGSRTTFVDEYGAEAASYPVGSRIYVRVEDHNADTPGQFDTVAVTVSVPGGDSESLPLLETGKNTGIFLGSLPLEASPSFIAGNGKLQAVPGVIFTAVHQDALGFTHSQDEATVVFTRLDFIDEAGTPTTELLEAGTARLRMFDQQGNANPFAADSVLVALHSRYAGDAELLTLTETGADTNVFEGTLELVTGFQQVADGRLQTLQGPPPEYLPEEVTADAYDSHAAAHVAASRLLFLDAFGRPVPFTAVGDRLRLRLIDHTQDNPQSRDSQMVQVTSLRGGPSGDTESVTLTETGFHTGVYEGSLPTEIQGGTAPATLQTFPGDVAEAQHFNTNTPEPTRAHVAIQGSSVLFVDAQGQPVVEYLESSRAFIRVVSRFANLNPGASDATQVRIETALTHDFEFVTLTETGPSTDVFTGSIPLRLGPAQPGDSFLETQEAAGPPHEYDLLTAAYNDPFGSSLASAGLLGSRTTFVDAYGTPVSSFAIGSRIYVRVEDHNADTPGQIDTVPVTVRVLGLDSESFPLTETGPSAGVFTGSIPLEQSASFIPGDHKLQVSSPGIAFEAEHVDALGYTRSKDQAIAVYAAVSFIDAAGTPTSVLIEGGTARLRLFSQGANTSPGSPDTALISLHSRFADDAELVTLTETGPSTNVFEGMIPMSAGPASQADGRLQTLFGPYPEFLQDEVTADAFDSRATAHVIGSQAWFLNLRGQIVTTYPLRSIVRVRVQNPTADFPAQIDSMTVLLCALGNGDEESLTLTETGPSTGIFEGTLPTVDTSTSGQNGVLTAAAGETVEVTSFNTNTPEPTRAQATFLAAFAPSAVDDTAQTVQDTAVTIPVLANDNGAPPLTVAAVSQAAHGTVAANANGTVTYTPASGYFGPDSFTYVLVDNQGGEAQAAVAVTVTPANRASVANNDTATVAEDGTVNVAVLANDTDPDNDTLSVTAVTQGAHGAVVINPDKTVKYTPAANYNGSDTFTYTINDGHSHTATATVTVTITSVNDAPTAVADSATVAEDGTVDIAVLSNDTDPENDTLSVTAVTQGAHGAVVINPDKTVKYTPAANYSGSDSFTYTISDGNGGSATGTVTVTVTAVNDAPTAVADSTTVAEDGSVNVPVLSNDTDPENDTLSVTAVTQGAHGTVVINPDKTVKYTPAANYNGSDSFTYTISDGNGGSATGTVTVTVTTVNDAPTAVADSTTVAEDGRVTVSVLANDTDPDNDTLSVTAVTQGAHGTVVINPDNTVKYSPSADYNGSDSFTYTISDGNGGSATGTVTVTVTAVNDAPIAVADSATVAEDGSVNVPVLSNDTDPENDTLSVTAVTQGAHGAVVINPDKTVKYTPAANYNGSDTFTYTISDGNGGSATGTVTVTVTAVNDAPIAVADSATVAEDGSVNVPALSNDTDPDNDTLSVTAVTQGAHGAVVINPDKTVKYTPAANYNGSDSFTYTVSDGNGGSATGTVTVTVTAVNDAPTAVADSTTVAEDGSVNVPVLSNDTDPDNDTLSVTAVTQGAHGAVVINPDKTVKYTPVANYNGSDTFTYTISDGNGGTATGTVTVTVTAVNDAPTAVADSTTVAEDGSVNVPVLSNDTDPENDTLSVTAVTQGAHGTVVINPDKTLKYTPAANYNGSDSFTYTISDGHGGSATAAVSITIAPVNDAPVAVNDTASTVAEVAVNVAVLANDVDVDGPSLLVTAVTQGAHGSVAIQPGQTAVTYTPAANWIGPDSFTYTISDGAGGTSTATVNVTVQAPPRVSTSLQVLYPFSEGSGTVVHDTSGVGTPLDLTISTPGAATWSAGALRFTATNLAQSAGNATKVITAVQASNALTVEAWIVPTNITQNGPAAIVAISLDKNKRDVTLGQTTSRYEHQLRTSTTNQGGNSLATGIGVVATNLQHVVFTRDSAGNAKTWVNGTLITSGTLSGNLSSWASYKIGIGNELSGGRPWLGTFHLVAVYSRALTAAEIHQNYLAGKDGN